MRQIRILLLVPVSYLIGCTSGTGSSETNNDHLKNRDSLSFSKEELSASYDVFFAPCNVEKSSRIKFAALFKRKKVDADLIVSMTGINCCHIDFLFSGLPQYLVYNTKQWDFDYEQLIKFKDDKRKCPDVITDYDKENSDFKVMSCDGNTQRSTLSMEALRFLNSKFLEEYPCEIEYTYEQIDSLHSLHL